MRGERGGVMTSAVVSVAMRWGVRPNRLSKESRERYVSNAVMRAAASPEAGCVE
jgi:hypothetical protein